MDSEAEADALEEALADREVDAEAEAEPAEGAKDTKIIEDVDDAKEEVKLLEPAAKAPLLSPNNKATVPVGLTLSVCPVEAEIDIPNPQSDKAVTQQSAATVVIE